MPAPENPKKCPNSTFDDPEKLKKIREKLKELQAETANWLNESKPQIVPYSEIFKSPEEYYKYVVSNITSPEDIMLVMRGRMTYYEDPQDRMYPAHTIIAAGFGDCENYSWLAKCLLDELGCKNNFDYNSRVIGIGTHAVCIYTDENGDTWSIDQHEKKKINTIYEASPYFKGKEKSNIDEDKLLNENIEEKIRLDEKLTNNYERITYVLYDQTFDKSFNPNKILPKEWNKYKMTQLMFETDVVNFVVVYQNGKLYSITNENKKETDFFDEKGNLDQRSYDGNDYVIFHKGTEKISQRIYKDGEMEGECFDLNGKLTQRNFKNGIIETYDPKTQKIKSRIFPDGDVEKEFYSPDGKVMQKNFRKNPGVKYETEWYDPNGALQQTKTFDGVIEITTPIPPSPTP